MAQGKKIYDQLRVLVRPVVEEYGFELFDLNFRREGHGWVLRIVIDRENGVTLDDCVSISREVGHLLEVEDLIEHAYNLEVSSPGLDRPLRNGADFKRFVGKMAKVTTCVPVDGQHHFVGRLTSFEDDTIGMLTEQGNTLDISLANVKKARLIVEI
jgi:ribosome maturation factor RimP